MIDKIKIFESWKKEILQLKELNDYNVYLVGSFNDYYQKKNIAPKSDYNFMDIDIWITDEKYNSEKIKPLILNISNISKKYEKQLTTESNLKFDFVYCTQKNLEITHFKNDNIKKHKFKLLYPLRPHLKNVEEIEMIYPSEKMNEKSSMNYNKIKPTLLKKQIGIN